MYQPTSSGTVRLAQPTHTAAPPPAPTTVCVQPDRIPAELTRRSQWVAWGYKWDQHSQRWKKPPVAPRTGGRASPTDSATWGTFDDAVEHKDNARLSGIGFVLTAEDPFVAVDLDDCVDPKTRNLTPFAEGILKELVSYTEYSPSGSGLRILVKGTLEGGNRKRPEIEISSDRQYVTITGDHVPRMPTEINDRSAELSALVARLFSDDQGHAQPSVISTPAPAPRQARVLARNDQAVLAQVRAQNGTRFECLFTDGDISAYDHDASRADLALCSMFAAKTRDPDQIDRLFQHSRLVRPKWEREDYREKTIAKALDGSNVPRSVKHCMTGSTGLGSTPVQPAAAPSHPAHPAVPPKPRPMPSPGDAGRYNRTCKGCGTVFNTKRGMGRRLYCLTCRERGRKRSTTPGSGNTQRAGRELTKEIRLRVLQRDTYKCRACRIRASMVAFIQPPGQGGAYTEANLLVLCDACRNVAPHVAFLHPEAKVTHIREARRLR